MAGSDRSKMRDNPWDPLAGNGRWRVWNSRRGKPSWPAVTSRINRPDIWMQAIRSDPQKTLVARGPSTYGSRPTPGLRRDDVAIISHSRGALRPRFAGILTPPQFRGRRECRMRAAPAVSCAVCTKECAHEHTGEAENIRHSLRNGFTAYNVLSPETSSW